jgi:LAS superfamily LD-carboxypeptidase LdcB
MAFPVVAVVEPAVLRGQTNGNLPASILVSTPGQAGGPEVILVEPAARAWRALAAAAKEAGHTLKISGPASAYRTYAEQERLFRQRFTTKPVSSTRRQWQGQTWYLRPGMALAAIPGTSNHGRGLAVDTGEERDGDTGTESIDDGTLKWLVKNEGRFGFSHEVQSEPWHLRYWAGDRIPAAVLYYELSLNPPSEEDDMPTIIECPGKPTRLLAAPTCAVIDGPTRDSWKKAGAKTVTYTPAAYDALLAHVEEALGRKVVDAVRKAA